MMPESVPYHIVDLNLRWHQVTLRVKTRRIVERPSGRGHTELLRRWAARWAARNGHVLQPELEVTDLSGWPEYFVRQGMTLGVAWRYIENGRSVLGDKELVVAPGIHVIRVPIVTTEDRAKTAAWLREQAVLDDADDDDLD